MGGMEASSAAWWGSKISAIFILMAVGAFGAWIPLALRRCKLDKVIAILNTFAGGAFLGLSVFHIMPEAAEDIEKANVLLDVGGGNHFNLAYVFLFLGYLAILVCERILTVDDAHGSHTAGTISEDVPGAQAERGSDATLCCLHTAGGNVELENVATQAEERTGDSCVKGRAALCRAPSRDITESPTEPHSVVVALGGAGEGRARVTNGAEELASGGGEGTGGEMSKACAVEMDRPGDKKDSAAEGNAVENRQKCRAVTAGGDEEDCLVEVAQGTTKEEEGRATCFCFTKKSEFDGASFFLMIALAIHGLFEGMIVGSEMNLISVWVITSVIAAHKWAESLMLMSQFIERGLDPRWYWTLMGVFVASSPVGILIGLGLSNEGVVASGVCNALGAGTLLYVAAETSAAVFVGSRKERVIQLLVYCLGAAMVLGLTLLDLTLESSVAGSSSLEEISAPAL
ncbi:metal cation transporter, ZIP family protein [Besnoitia besnoiti]|uniref:Metal cation transporter, ZIP family protein n=1 Tax=Besnoitia besnoiti TaxID=94643 RepID=A0A2A9MH72_BESBE|nr:metal cation transporter, ZIP family protein [Besnoitia besnoiti]PFH37878.1 metal cation transporter, ZIP family protein [Besnoitia besnoiti]